MTDLETIRNWVRGYVRAWESNDPADIRALFTEDAHYFTEPHAAPWVGHDEIVREWLDRKDEPGDHIFRFEVLAVDGDLGFVRGWTTYPGEKPKEYGNLWVVRVQDDGRASEYVEWWVRFRDATPPFPG